MVHPSIFIELEKGFLIASVFWGFAWFFGSLILGASRDEELGTLGERFHSGLWWLANIGWLIVLACLAGTMSAMLETQNYWGSAFTALFVGVGMLLDSKVFGFRKPIDRFRNINDIQQDQSAWFSGGSGTPIGLFAAWPTVVVAFGAMPDCTTVGAVVTVLVPITYIVFGYGILRTIFKKRLAKQAMRSSLVMMLGPIMVVTAGYWLYESLPLRNTCSYSYTSLTVACTAVLTFFAAAAYMRWCLKKYDRYLKNEYKVTT
jgi:hypothetical protein